MTPSRLSLLLRLACLALPLAAGGCACLHLENHCTFQGCDYEKATIVYELSGTCGALASTAIRRAYAIDPERGEAGDPVPDGRLTWQSALVTIQYPHPQQGPGCARATIRLSHVPVVRQPVKPKIVAGRMVANATHAVNPKFKVPEVVPEPQSKPRDGAPSGDEIWVMDVSKQELDLILCDLASNGFFAQQWRPSGGGRLYVAVDGCQTRKAWTPEPRLDDFIGRVFGEGSLQTDPLQDAAPLAPPHPVPGRTRLVSPPGVLPVPPAPSPAPGDDARGARESQDPGPVKPAEEFESEQEADVATPAAAENEVPAEAADNWQNDVPPQRDGGGEKRAPALPEAASPQAERGEQTAEPIDSRER